jgi:dihydroxyacetone kinase
MPGFSITLLLLPREGDASAPSSQQVLSLLDDKPSVPAWKWSFTQPPAAKASQIVQSTAKAQQPKPRILKAVDPQSFVKIIRQAANALIEAESEITRMDLIAGDGDCGLTLKV